LGGSLKRLRVDESDIEAGAAGVHFRGSALSAKKCGHLGGKWCAHPEFIEKLSAARLAADVCGVPTILNCAHRCEFGGFALVGR